MPQGQNDCSAATCFRKPTTSSASDLSSVATRADVVRLASPAGTLSVSSPPLRAPSGWLKKSRLAVRVRRRPDRNYGKGRETPTRDEKAGPRSGRRSLARVEGERKGSEAPSRERFPAASLPSLAAAKDGEVVGPVATPQGFALARIEQRRPAELDAAARQRIQEELFDPWLAPT